MSYARFALIAFLYFLLVPRYIADDRLQEVAAPTAAL